MGWIKSVILVFLFRSVVCESGGIITTNGDCSDGNLWMCHDGTCVVKNFLCDGFNQCPDNSDEFNCTGSSQSLKCSPDEFMCDHMCIHATLVCNGEPDCRDNTDENNCTVSCQGFTCKNDHCIITDWVCDGADDCGDGSDEMHCDITNGTVCDINEGFYACKDKSICLPAERVCDGRNDCKDGSDEGGECAKNIENCVKAKCNHSCFATPKETICICDNGYGKVDNNTCEDIDECHLFHDHCSHYCHNHPGYFQCSCAPGYQMLKDNSSCLAEGESPVIIFSDGHSILKYFTRTKKYYPITNVTNIAIGVAYDGEYVYWSTTAFSYESISRIRLDGSDQKVIIKTGLRSVEDVAVDWYTKNIYFTDSEMKHIGVCTNDGAHCTVVINRHMDKPRSIVLNPEQGEMFWSDWGIKPEIAKSLMDGSDDKAIVYHDIVWPNGLTMDYPNNRLYWVDAKLNRIESVRPDGSFRVKVLHNVQHPFSIAVFENELYWSNWATKSLESCNKFTGKDKQVLPRSNTVYGLRIYHPVMMEKRHHACEHNKCEHICMLKGKDDFACACPEGKILNTDGKTCHSAFPERYLIIGTGNEILTVHHQNLGGHTTERSQLPVSHIHLMVYDFKKDRVIIYDSDTKTIYNIGRYMEKDPDVKILVSNGIGSITGMDLDYITRNLYWCDPVRRTLEVLSLDNGNHTVLMKELNGDMIMNIVLVPELGTMYLIIQTVDGKLILSKTSMDGNGAFFHIFEYGLIGPQITMHYNCDFKFLFIADSGCECIHLLHIEGHHKGILFQHVSNIGSLTTLENELFWSKKHSKELFWSSYLQRDNVIRHNKMDSPNFTSQMVLKGVSTCEMKPHECTLKSPCSHMCLQRQVIGDSFQAYSSASGPFENQYSCFCPAGMVLDIDGKTCKTEVVCQKGQYKCKKSNICIDMSRRCDSKNDCNYSEDEAECADNPKCGENEFQCNNGECIPRENRCNKKKECSDESDEVNCEFYDPKKRCDSRQFECHSGLCLEMRLKCDGVPDCPDKDDENNCLNSTCSADQFQCETGNCIPKNWECDREYDCSDGTDEHVKCEYFKPCEPNKFRCDFGRCIDKKLLCNKINDCGDYSDEEDCPSASDKLNQGKECDETSFMCGQNTTACVPYNARCNGTTECANGEDEELCDGDDSDCPHHEWKCHTKDKCIPKSWLCDGEKDCLDASDEDIKVCKEFKDHHSAYNKISKPVEESSNSTHCIDKYRCNDGQCIDYAFLCDDNHDCRDGSDEYGLCSSSCQQHVCSEKCRRSPHGSICECEKGRTLAADGHSCVQEPPLCSKYPLPCHHICDDTKGSFVCRCFEGYTLKADRRTCKAIEGNKIFLYITDGDLRKQSHDSSIEVLYSEPDTKSKLVGMDVFVRNGSVFFTNEKLGQIHHLNYITKKKTLISNIGKPRMIAVDWVTENVYFVNNDVNKTIMVCHMDKRKCAKILDLDKKSKVYAFAVDPINRLMFYSLKYLTPDKTSKSIIYKAHLDGSHVTELVKDDLDLCKGLSVDYERKLLYFSDENRGTVESINYEMSHRRVIIHEGNIQNTGPIGLDLFEDKMYFIQNGSTKLVVCSLFGHFQCTLSELRIKDSHEIKIGQANKQKMVRNNCADKKCTHICVQNELGAMCLCYDGKKIDENAECSNQESNPEFRDVDLKKSDESQVRTPKKGMTALVVIFISCFLILSTIFLYRFQKKRLKKLADFDFSVHFQNPGFGGGLANFAHGLGNITSRFTNFTRPEQPEFSNPLSTKPPPSDWPPSALDLKSLQLKQKIPGCQSEVPDFLGDSDSDVESNRDFHEHEHKEKARLLP